MGTRRAPGGIGSNQYGRRGTSRTRPRSGRVAAFEAAATNDGALQLASSHVDANVERITAELRAAGPNTDRALIVRIAERELDPVTAAAYAANAQNAISLDLDDAAAGLATLIEVERAWIARGRPEPSPQAGMNRLVLGWDHDTVVKVSYGGHTRNSDRDLAAAEAEPDVFAATWPDPDGGRLVQFQERVTPLTMEERYAAAYNEAEELEALWGWGQFGRRVSDGRLVAYDTE